MNIETALTTYRVDMAHARKVADLAIALFDVVEERYELNRNGRYLLEIGAMLHNVGMTIDQPTHHIVGRDIVLYHVFEDLSPQAQALVACMVVFHRKKVRPQAEPAFLSLGKKDQKLVLKLSAILRVADGLDYSQSQTTQLCSVELLDSRLTMHLSGPYAPGDGARAVDKADLWRKVFGDELDVKLEESQSSAPPLVEAPVEEASLSPWYAASETALAELGRVLLRRHFRRMLAAERDVRGNKAIEPIHELRVATRRLRAIMRLLAVVAPADELRHYTKRIQRLARTAGAVRDRDVLLAHMRASVERMPADQAAALEQLMARLAEERAAAHSQLIKLLDSDEIADFKHDFAAFMNSQGGWDESPCVRDLAGSTIWRHYEALRAHTNGSLPDAPEELHAMRVEGKRLRYVLELFGDTFGPRGDTAIEPLVAFQDHLGALNDISVARELLQACVGDDAGKAAADAYLALRDIDAARLTRELPARWDKLSGATYRRKLMELIVRL